MQQIQLTRGQVALVDDDDYEWLSQWKWFVHRNRGNWYAGRQQGTLSMHRLIMGCTKGDGMVVDHINHNGLDNRRSNLRICTNSQNQMNRKKPSVGVWFNKRKQKWKAQIKVNQKLLHLGFYTTREEAIAARQAAEVVYFGEFAPTR